MTNDSDSEFRREARYRWRVFLSTGLVVVGVFVLLNLWTLMYVSEISNCANFVWAFLWIGFWSVMAFRDGLHVGRMRMERLRKGLNCHSLSIRFRAFLIRSLTLVMYVSSTIGLVGVLSRSFDLYQLFLRILILGFVGLSVIGLCPLFVDRLRQEKSFLSLVMIDVPVCLGEVFASDLGSENRQGPLRIFYRLGYLYVVCVLLMCTGVGS